MNVAIFGSKQYTREYFDAVAPDFDHALTYFESRLRSDTAPLAESFDAVCIFVNDDADRATLEKLHAAGVRVVALRCSGFNNVDLAAAERLGITVVRVPAYSPHAVAEHAAALILALNRKTHRAYNRVREGNFALEGLTGFDLCGRTVGIVGAGRIGQVLARIMTGFECRILAFDPYPNDVITQLGGAFVDLDTLLAQSDIISLHCPLSPQTHHLIDASAVDRMKPGVMLINSSRGALLDTQAAIDGLKSGQIGYLGLDVYEEEADLFFENLSDQVIKDDVFARLLTFPNVLITGHQAFFTADALRSIAQTTLSNLAMLDAGQPCPNVVESKRVVAG